MLTLTKSPQETDNYIYVMISQTPTKFGRAIRKIGKIHYNHASVAFDSELNTLCSFARQRHAAVLTGKLVKETISRYTLGKCNSVDVVIFKIPASTLQIEQAEKLIADIEADDEYIYNLFSVLFYPLTKGLTVYKAFTCIEFVLFLLHSIGFDFGTDKPLRSYKPDDLLQVLEGYEFFRGNLLDYRNNFPPDGSYFAPFSLKDMKESAVALCRLFARLITASILR